MKPIDRDIRITESKQKLMDDNEKVDGGLLSLSFLRKYDPGKAAAGYGV